MSEETKPHKQSDYSSRTCRVWTYEKPKETSKGTSVPKLIAIGLNYKNDLIIFDLYSYEFLIGIHRQDLLPKIPMTFITGEPISQSIVNLVSGSSNNMNENDRKRKIHHIMNHTTILPSELMSEGAYQSGIKVNRILNLEQKKHKIIITFTHIFEGRERKKDITIYDSISDYDGLLKTLNEYKTKSEHICPRCGSFMEKGYCENCIGKEPVTEDPVIAKKQKISLIAYTTIAVIMIVIMLLIPFKVEYLIPKIIFIILALAFTIASLKTVGEIIQEKRERVDL